MTQENATYLKHVQTAAREKQPLRSMALTATSLTQSVLDKRLPNQAEALLHLADYIVDTTAAKHLDAEAADPFLQVAFNAAGTANMANPALREPAQVTMQKSYGLMSSQAKSLAQFNAQEIVSAPQRYKPQKPEAAPAIGFAQGKKSAGKEIAVAHDPEDMPRIAVQKIADICARLKARQQSAGRT